MRYRSLDRVLLRIANYYSKRQITAASHHILYKVIIFQNDAVLRRYKNANKFMTTKSFCNAKENIILHGSSCSLFTISIVKVSVTSTGRIPIEQFISLEPVYS